MHRHDGHLPVLYDEAIHWLDLRPGLTVVDGTLGGCGHARAILERIMPGGVFIGIDRDAEAICRARELLGDRTEPVHIVHADFREIVSVLLELGISTVDRVLLDLGVSSFQLEDAERGFSYMQNARLDMRMDQEDPLSAWEVVNEYPVQELARIFRMYGEEKWGARIAQFIVERRKSAPVDTTEQLVQIIKDAVPASARREGPHPTKRVFQAIRIEVNRELEGLGRTLEAYVDVLSCKGRLAVITFHSLEDRIVKQEFARLQAPCTCPPDFPVCVCGKKPKVRILTRKPVGPSAEELEYNPRARSAKLRVAERI